MAHTPLFARLVGAVRTAGEAAVRDVPVHQVLEERALRAEGISRRAFLARAAVGAAAVAVPAALPRPARAQAAEKVVVVGGGLAGLTAAYRLRQAGVRATVYEAASRLGGRCFTLRDAFAEGQVAEHGGELIDQYHKEIRQLVQELGLDLDNLLAAEANGTEPSYWFGGAGYPYAEATDDLKAIWQTLHRDVSEASYPTTYRSYTPRGWELDHMSIRDWIEASIPGGMASRLGQLLEQAYVIEYGAEIADQSALNLLYLLGYTGPGQLRIFGTSNEKYHVRGGNDRIVQRLGAALDGQIEPGAALVAIQRTAAGRVTLTFARGAGGTFAVTADRVVLAVPFSILRASVDLEGAGFDEVKRMAIREQGMGANSKLNVQFGARGWRTLGSTGETYADTGYQCTWEVSRGQPGTSGILVNFTGGDYARSFEGGDPAALTARFLQELAPVLPGVGATWNGRATVDAWSANPWSKGAYSYWRVGQYTAFAGAEGEASGPIHFCGEHTSIDSQGYLNGAVETGERAAGEVLDALRAAAR